MPGIAGRKKMEEAVLQNEEKFRFLFEKSAEPILLLHNGRFIDCNEAAVRLAQCSSREGLIGLTPLDLSPEKQPDGRLSSEKARDVHKTTLRQGTNRFEWMNRTAKGEEFWIEVSHTVIPIQGKDIICMTWRDIRTRKRAEGALQQAEAKYRTIFENASMGIYQTTLRGRIISANPALARILGYNSPQELMEFIADIGTEVYADPRSRVRIAELCMKYGVVEGFETQFRKKDKSLAWLSVNARAIKDAEGNIMYFEGTMEDVTARKRAEEELATAHQRLFDIIEFLPDATFVIDDDRKVVAWNLACEKMTGVRKEEIIGKGDYTYAIPFYGKRRPQLIDYVTMDCDSDELQQTYMAIRQEGRLLHGETFVPMLYNGKGAFLSGNASPLFDRAGKVTGAIESLRDITEFKHLETQLRQSQKMQAVGTLAGGIAHDFNNILTALVGYASLLKMKMGNGVLCAYVDQILSASQKATDLVQSLLAFSRQQAISLKPVSIQGLIRGTEKLLRRLVTEDIDIRTLFVAEDITVMADTSQIDQILFNLTTNARDAMPQGGILAIETKTVDLDDKFQRCHGYGKVGRYALLSVSDTGVGMDKATQERIFDPFFTTKETGKGTGLGLSTVYGIVKQHDGFITVYSEPNTGTTFHICLPAADQSDKKGVQSVLTSAKGGAETIVVAEDNEEVRGLMREVLVDCGYTVIEATDGANAVELFRKAEKVDLLIFDSVMPKMNGLEAFNEIHKVRPDINPT
jgi:two-component system cell cycle sensor histidine kinase/response regulator CckA